MGLNRFRELLDAFAKVSENSDEKNAKIPTIASTTAAPLTVRKEKTNSSENLGVIRPKESLEVPKQIYPKAPKNLGKRISRHPEKPFKPSTGRS